MLICKFFDKRLLNSMRIGEKRGLICVWGAKIVWEFIGGYYVLFFFLRSFCNIVKIEVIGEVVDVDFLFWVYLGKTFRVGGIY